ncbi:hypothetical protein CEXT_203901 [Caerostris extrusa]|uniref:Uncharacterized protein n=1 Tax=Caerostris extrusa TaxID=172846 RepID=A0AAV4XGL3_CAEEX|nr:hypothetical protein CEXT_203901 [Caerostris extrusa]
MGSKTTPTAISRVQNVFRAKRQLRPQKAFSRDSNIKPKSTNTHCGNMVRCSRGLDKGPQRQAVPKLNFTIPFEMNKDHEQLESLTKNNHSSSDTDTAEESSAFHVLALYIKGQRN